MLLIEGRIAKHDRSNWPSLSSTWPTFFSTLSIFFMIATKNTSYSQKVGIQVPLSLMPPWRWGNIDQVKDVIKLGGGFAPLNRTPPPPLPHVVFSSTFFLEALLSGVGYNTFSSFKPTKRWYSGLAQCGLVRFKFQFDQNLQQEFRLVRFWFWFDSNQVTPWSDLDAWVCSTTK